MTKLRFSEVPSYEGRITPEPRVDHGETMAADQNRIFQNVQLSGGIAFRPQAPLG